MTSPVRRDLNVSNEKHALKNWQKIKNDFGHQFFIGFYVLNFLLLNFRSESFVNQFQASNKHTDFFALNDGIAIPVDPIVLLSLFFSGVQIAKCTIFLSVFHKNRFSFQTDSQVLSLSLSLQQTHTVLIIQF